MNPRLLFGRDAALAIGVGQFGVQGIRADFLDFLGFERLVLRLAQYISLLCSGDLLDDHELFRRQGRGRSAVRRLLPDREFFVLLCDELVLAVGLGEGLGGGCQGNFLNLSGRGITLLIIENGLKIQLLHIVAHVDH